MKILEKINKVIDSDIRPVLNADGGDIEVLEYKNKILKVKLKGACHGCPMAEFTLKDCVETILKENFPEIKEVVNEE